LGLRLSQATLDLDLIGPANPTIDAWRIPKSGSHRCSLGLIVGIDLPHRSLDLERVKCARARGYLFCSDHPGLACGAQCGSVLKVRGLVLETPLLANLKRRLDACAVGRPVFPNVVVDAAPGAVEHDLPRTCCAPG